MTSDQLNALIQAAVDGIAAYAAENGKTAAEVLADSTAIDDDTLKKALAFQAELNGPSDAPTGELKA